MDKSKGQIKNELTRVAKSILGHCNVFGDLIRNSGDMSCETRITILSAAYSLGLNDSSELKSSVSAIRSFLTSHTKIDIQEFNRIDRIYFLLKFNMLSYNLSNIDNELSDIKCIMYIFTRDEQDYVKNAFNTLNRIGTISCQDFVEECALNSSTLDFIIEEFHKYSDKSKLTVNLNFRDNKYSI